MKVYFLINSHFGIKIVYVQMKLLLLIDMKCYWKLNSKVISIGVGLGGGGWKGWKRRENVFGHAIVFLRDARLQMFSSANLPFYSRFLQRV